MGRLGTSVLSELWSRHERLRGEQEWHTVLTLNVHLGIVKNIYRKAKAKAKYMLQILMVFAKDTSLGC